MRFVDIRNDIAFRKIFGNEKKTVSLISFINAALKLEKQKRIVSVKIENTNQFPRIAGEKASVIDVTVTDQRGRQFAVEIQITDKNGFNKRIKYLHAKFMAERIAHTDFDSHWDNVRLWSEKSRYNPIGTQTLTEITIFFESLKIIIEWIKAQ